MKSSERMVEVNGVELCSQTFGNADDPAVLEELPVIQRITETRKTLGRRRRRSR